jgi:hypothetical protein
MFSHSLRLTRDKIILMAVCLVFCSVQSARTAADRPRYGQTVAPLCLSENCMPSVLTITVQVMERNPCAQKHKNYRKFTEQRVLKRRSLNLSGWPTSIQHANISQHINYFLNLSSVYFPHFFVPKSLKWGEGEERVERAECKGKERREGIMGRTGK